MNSDNNSNDEDISQNILRMNLKNDSETANLTELVISVIWLSLAQ